VDWLLLDEVRMQRWAPENTAMKQWNKGLRTSAGFLFVGVMGRNRILNHRGI
jgi:hypothetical protein